MLCMQMNRVGRKLTRQLAAHGVDTVGDAQQLSQLQLEKWVGTKGAVFLRNVVRGIDATPVTPRCVACASVVQPSISLAVPAVGP